MINPKSEIEDSGPDEINDILLSSKGKWNFEEERSYSFEEIAELFRYLFALVQMNDHAEGSRVMDGLKGAIDSSIAAHPDDKRGYEYLLEWGLLAIRLTPEDRREFNCMPAYLALLQQLGHAPAEFQYLVVRLRLQLVHHYEYWEKQGGSTEYLSDEDFEMLENATEHFLNKAESEIESALSRNDHDALIHLKRSLSRYYFSREKPNDGLRLMKELVDHLSQATGYTRADEAELYMEIGKIYAGYKKYQTARKYFEQALEIFKDSGEESEMNAMQAESLIEDCDRHL